MADPMRRSEPLGRLAAYAHSKGGKIRVHTGKTGAVVEVVNRDGKAVASIVGDNVAQAADRALRNPKAIL